MIQSRLTIHGMLARFGFFALNAGIIFIPVLLLKEKASILKWCFYILVIIFSFIMSLIVVLITRKISIDLDKITYTNWLTGKVKVYNFKDLDGYITVIKSGQVMGTGIGRQYEDFESVILVKENKRIGEISSYRYSNYDELKAGLKDLKYLGQEDNNIFNSYKDNFIELLKC